MEICKECLYPLRSMDLVGLCQAAAMAETISLSCISKWSIFHLSFLIPRRSSLHLTSPSNFVARLGFSSSAHDYMNSDFSVPKTTAAHLNCSHHRAFLLPILKEEKLKYLNFKPLKIQ
ncbi:hypothetical protein NMG60_11033484 [Bertholletia excelsa]